jgi:hypothetical protein
MNYVSLVVRDAECDWSGTVHGGDAECVIAALGADPMTLLELETACTRFEDHNSTWRLSDQLTRSSSAEPYDAGLVAIDLVASMVVQYNIYSRVGRDGDMEYKADCTGKRDSLRFHIADDWLFTEDSLHWRGVADRRRAERSTPLYGRPLLEYLARELFSRVDLEQPNEGIRAVHADWMLTPRDDLRGACPREYIVERRNHIGWELQDRGEAWSQRGVCPAPLETSSHAYRFGGFGTHEAVTYYDLVRELLCSCFEQIDTHPHLRSHSLGDFLTTEVLRLEAVREAWLDSPDPEFHGCTPRSIIQRERARIPEAMSKHESIVDPDCACCQAMADLPGMAFWGLDGCNMDEDFAFDFWHRTKEEWDKEQRDREAYDRWFNAKWAERERLGVATYAQERDPVWSRSFVADDAELPLGARIFGIGCRLAEVIASLKSGTDISTEAREHIDRLNRNFGNLREILQGDDVSLAVALIEPVMDRFIESLDTTTAYQPDLTNRCESLAEELRTLLKPPSPERDPSDFDIPF